MYIISIHFVCCCCLQLHVSVAFNLELGLGWRMEWNGIIMEIGSLSLALRHSSVALLSADDLESCGMGKQAGSQAGRQAGGLDGQPGGQTGG